MEIDSDEPILMYTPITDSILGVTDDLLMDFSSTDKSEIIAKIDQLDKKTLETYKKNIAAMICNDKALILGINKLARESASSNDDYVAVSLINLSDKILELSSDHLELQAILQDFT